MGRLELLAAFASGIAVNIVITILFALDPRAEGWARKLVVVLLFAAASAAFLFATRDAGAAARQRAEYKLGLDSDEYDGPALRWLRRGFWLAAVGVLVAGIDFVARAL